ncbi:hypothetical protein DFP72DRAFT_851541 [Ephemerocybe angulata]|uniref:Uncharacterized protein n=1 Tax=Ephemerocybe angulata TaxID=980116 RepID=A0A8H6M1B5_9AGAR|nr:hypothetical protein DFP72DRAFT_851541 [Tulosesus angulatus]
MEASSVDRRESSGDASLLSLANETLTIVAALLASAPVALTRFMLACRRTVDVGEHVRYSSLILSGAQGRRLMAALLSGSTNIPSLLGWADSDLHLNTALLADVLPRLSNLKALWLDANPLDAIHLMERMKKNGIVRSRVHPALVIGDMASGSPSSSLTLVSLDVAHFLDHDDLANFLSASENTVLGDTLETLSLKLGKSLDIGLALPLVRHAYPNLRNFSLEQKQLDIRAVLDCFTVPSLPWRKLRVLVLNRLYPYRIPRWGTTFACEGLSKDDMAALLSRISVWVESFGRLGGYGYFVRKVFKYPDVERHADGWTSIFGEQLELDRFVESSLNRVPQPVGVDWVVV